MCSPPPDIIGYPIYSGFNVDLLFWGYGFALILASLLGGGLLRLTNISLRPVPQESASRYQSLFFLIVFPILLFALHAKIPGTLETLNLFHEGESLVPALLSQKGYFPWRDFIVARGWLQDVGIALLGFSLFENSYWGFHAAVTAVWFPATILSVYFLLRFLFKGNGKFLVIASALPFLIPNLFYFPYPRLLPLPFVLLAFARFLKLGSRSSAALFAFSLALLGIVNPESSFLFVSLGITLLLFDSIHRDFRRTISAAFFLMFWIAVWFAYLQTQGAIDGFLHYYRHYVSGHAYGSGIPVLKNANPWFYAAIALPVLLHAFFVWYWIPIIKKACTAETGDWVVLGLHLFNLLYFRKFLSRADTHLWQVHAMNVPVLLWVLSRCFGTARGLRYVAWAACAVFIWKAASIPKNLLPANLTRSSIPRLGYFVDHPEVISGMENLGRVLGEHLQPSDPLFDFSNEPALFFYLLDRRPSTPYYEVSLAVREKTQEFIIERLRRDPPKLVVFYGIYGRDVWNDPIPNSVRHWKLSRFLLENYRPLSFTSGHLILKRNDLLGKSTDPELYFHTPFCDWGLIPHFWKGETPTNDSRPLTFTSLKGVKYWETKISGNFQKANNLEFDFASTTDDDFFLTDESEPDRSLERVIFFKSAKSSQAVYRIPVSACPQWWGYQSKTLYLYSKEKPQLTAVRVSNQ